MLPFALIGGIVGLFATGQYLSVPSAIGFIAVFGVAMLNGIVLVAFMNEQRERYGRSTDEAVRQAASLHYDAFKAAVSEFLYRHRAALAEEMVRLTTRGAPTQDETKAALEKGIQEVLNRLLHSFGHEEIADVRRTADSPGRLRALRDACDGTVDKLERTIGSRPGLGL